jgi:hypothetical protein
MPELSVPTLLLFAAFVVPGAISLQIYKLKVPSPDRTLQERLLEAVVFGTVNFALLYWAIAYALAEHTMRNRPVLSYLVLVLCLFVAPTIWPFILFLL